MCTGRLSGARLLELHRDLVAQMAGRCFNLCCTEARSAKYDPVDSGSELAKQEIAVSIGDGHPPRAALVPRSGVRPQRFDLGAWDRLTGCVGQHAGELLITPVNNNVGLDRLSGFHRNRPRAQPRVAAAGERDRAGGDFIDAEATVSVAGDRKIPWTTWGATP